MQWLIQNETGYALGWTVVHSLWQGIVLAIAVGSLLVFLRQRSPIFKSTLLLMVMAFMPIISMITFIVVYPTRYVDPNLLKGTALEGLPTPPALEETVTNMAGEVISNLSVSNFVLYINSHMVLIITIWLVGVGISVLRLLSGVSYVHYLKNNFTIPLDPYWHEMLSDVKSKLGVTHKSINIVESALVKSPMIIGHLKPMILMPIGIINQLSDKQVEAILAHEVAHIMRKDYLINILQNIIESLYYFHPAMWWISAQLRNEREKCCDDLAVKACDDKISYVKALVAMQELSYTHRGLAMAFAGKSNDSLLDRVNRLVQPKAEILTIQEKLYSSGLVIILFLTFQLPNVWTNKENLHLSQSASYYLKYDLDDRLDSLHLKFPVNDGMYRKEDEFQDVVLEVFKNKVVKFTINGLNIAGHDMVKFQKLIESIIIEHPNDELSNMDLDETFIDEESINITSNKTIIVDKNKNQYEITTTELGDNHLKIINNNGSVSNYEIINGVLFKNNEPWQEGELNSLGWEITPAGFALTNKSKKSEHKNSNSKKSEIPEIININSDDSVRVSVCQNDQFQKWANDYLLENGIVKPNQDYSYMLNFERLIVNGVILSDEVKKLWQNKYASVNNVEFDNSTYVTGNFTY